MKLKIRDKGGRHRWFYVPNRVMLWALKRKAPGMEMDTHKVLKLLRKYRGMTILEVQERRGDYIRIKL